MKRLRVLGEIGSLIVLASCALARSGAPVSVPRIETDSAEYHMTVGAGMPRVDIPFRYINGADVASLNYCVNEPMPALEKNVDGSWITAVDAFVLTCLQLPPFRIERGTTYEHVLRAIGGRRGSSVLPQWRVVEFPGIYRLHWVLVAGPDPDRPHASHIDVVSPTFTITVVP